MGFETRVLNVVADVLGSEKCAGFEYGEMTVYCTEYEARSIFRKLTNEFYATIDVSKIDDRNFKFAFPL